MPFEWHGEPTRTADGWTVAATLCTDEACYMYALA